MPRQKDRISGVGGRSVHDHAVAHVQHAIAVSGRFGIVRDHHDRLAEILIELDAAAPARSSELFVVQISRGLIGQDDFRLADDRARQSHALLFAAGKLRRLVLQPV